MTNKEVWAMKKRLITIGFIVCSVLLVAACGKEKVKGSGTITTQTRTVDSFEHINASGVMNLMVTTDDSQSITVTADDNLQSYITMTVKKGTLVIATKKEVELVPTKPIQLTISVSKLKSLTSKDTIKANVAHIDNKMFTLHCSGYSQAMLAGEVKKASLEVNGYAQVDTRKLEADEVSLDVSDSGKVMISVKKKLTVKISDKGQVVYYGKPPVINQAVFGDGKLEAGSE